MPPNIPKAQSNPNLILQAHTQERYLWSENTCCTSQNDPLQHPKILGWIKLCELISFSIPSSNWLGCPRTALRPVRWSEAKLAARCRYYHLLLASGTSGQPAFTLFRLLQKTKTKKDNIIYYQPQVHPAELFPQFSTFWIREFADNSYFYIGFRSIFTDWPSLIE